MFDIIAQICIILLCMGGMLLVNDHRPALRRWGPVLGLLSEPFWFYITYTHHQWGIFASAFVYTFAWARGFYNAWIRKPCLN